MWGVVLGRDLVCPGVEGLAQPCRLQSIRLDLTYRASTLYSTY